MYPFIVPGRDEVIIEPVGSYIPKRSDIVLYRRKQGLLFCTVYINAQIKDSIWWETTRQRWKVR